MRYLKLKGDKLFDGQQFVDDSILLVQEDGTIEAIIPDDGQHGDLKKLDGVLMPAHINCHCHLELSHLKGVIPPGTGLVPFLISVVQNRGKQEALKEKAIAAAEAELFKNAIVAVADVCNTSDTVAIKKSSTLYWHNLVEVLNFYDAGLEKAWVNYSAVQKDFEKNNLDAVLTPHAPYTVSAATLQALNAATAGKVISMHNQETAAEDALFKTGDGDFLHLYQTFSNGQSPFAVSGKSSLQTWLPYFNNGQTILLVHNTFIKEEDILFANAHAAKYGLRLIYCLCANANLYIENKLPPVDLLLKHHCTIVLGTDSYSSNWQLSIAAEIKTLQQHFKHIPLQTMLQWATSNGAAVWGFEKVGFLKRGYKPGVALLNEKSFAVERIV